MSNIRVLDTDFKVVGIIDSYESFIWTDRFKSPGDFEIYAPVSSKYLELLQQNRYLDVDFSEHNMIIETVEIETSFDAGQKMKVTGRSLESLLDRRIVWDQTTVQGNLQNAIKTLITKAFINPGSSQAKQARKISNFKFLDTTNEEITELKLNKAQYTGDQIDQIINDMCEAFGNFGYRILFGYQMNYIYYGTEGYTPFNDYDFVFELYTGLDFSYDQFYNPYIIFSPEFGNLKNSNYIDSLEGSKNVTLVAGEGEGSSRTRIIVGGKDTNNNWIPALYRRELYTDARDLQSSDYPSGEYKDALKQRGMEKLLENSRITSFEGEVESTKSFVYGRDFFIGDIVQVENEYGIAGKTRVLEWVRSESSSGIDMYPTFDAIQFIDDSEEPDVPDED